MLNFDDFEQTTQLLRQRLGVLSWDHLWTGSPHAKQYDSYNINTAETVPRAAMPVQQLELEGGKALAYASSEEDMSAFSSETRALLQQLQAVKV